MAVGFTLSAVSLFFAVAVSQRSKVSNVEWESFQLLNELRAAGYTCPDQTKYAPNSRALLFDCRLWRASYKHSEDMEKNGYFSHYSQNGDSPWDRAKRESNGAFIANAENIAINSVAAAGAIEAWKRSNGHCKNMMNASRTSMGVGSSNRYWTQMLGGQNANQVDTSCYPDAAPQDPTPGPTAGATAPAPGGDSDSADGEAPKGHAGDALTGAFDPTRCAIQEEAKGAKCAKCVTGAQCASAYGPGWYCCPYMKKCVNSASMPCFTPTARCSPRCYANNFADAIKCSQSEGGGCNWDLNNWVDGCSKADWEGWNKPRATPAPEPTPTPAPTESTNDADKFTNVAEFKVYCNKLGDDEAACSACGGKFQAKKGKCKLAKSAKKVKCKKIKNDDVCAMLGCGQKKSKCNGKPQNIL